MDRVLEQIRGVPGVSGVIMVDRIDRKLWKLLPSRFDDGEIGKLESILGDMADRVDSDSSFTIRFQSGWLVARVTEEIALFILARDELRLETLDLVTKASLAAIRSVRSSETEPESLEDFDPQSAHILVTAVNYVAKHFIQIVGAFEAASLLRKTKEQLLNVFPMLKHFPVDNNGNVTLIRGSEKYLNETVVDAVARWCFYFKETVNIKTPVVGFDVKAVTADIEFELSELGFYSSYRRASLKTTKMQ